MKNRVLVFVLLSCMVVLTGCINPNSGEPVKNLTGITVYISIGPNKANQTGPTSYLVNVRISDDEATDYSAVVVKVNEIDIPYYESTGIFIKTLDGMNSGDPVEVSISDPDIGDHTYSTEIPPAVTGFTLSPELPSLGTANESTTYTMTWVSTTGGHEYCAVVWGYQSSSATDFISGTGRGFAVTSNTCTFQDSYLRNPADNSIIPFLKFWLNSQMRLSIPGFSATSTMYVYGPSSIEKVN